MPAQRILNVLGMTPAQWGVLTQEERLVQRKKADAIFAAEAHAEANANIRDRGPNGGLIPRVEAIEASVRSVANDAGERITGLERQASSGGSKVSALETRMAAMERGYSSLEKTVVILDKKVEEMDTHVKKLEKK